MKFTIDKNDFEKALHLASPFLEKKNSDTIIANYFIEATNEFVEVVATDLRGGLRVKVQNGIFVEKTGKVLVNGSELLRVLKGTRRENLVFEKSGEILRIEQGKTKLEIKSISANFPDFPVVSDKKSIKFNGDILKEAFKKFSPSIDGTSPKYELTGGLIAISEDGVRFVSTDTKRLTVVHEKIEFPNIDELELIIPKQAILEIPKLFDGEVEFFYDSENLLIVNSSLYFFTKLINGNYPNWKRIVPDEFEHEFKFDKNTFLENVRLVANIKQELKITLFENRVSLETISDSGSKTKGETEFYVPESFPEKIEFGFNSKFVLDALNVLDEDDFTLQFNEANRPFVIVGENFKTIVMPINL